jgi:hypothetical protein
MTDLKVITRGADLTDEDLRLIVEDFVAVRNWAALRMRLGVPDMKEQLFQALRARLGRRPLVVATPEDGKG